MNIPLVFKETRDIELTDEQAREIAIAYLMKRFEIDEGYCYKNGFLVHPNRQKPVFVGFVDTPYKKAAYRLITLLRDDS